MRAALLMLAASACADPGPEDPLARALLVHALPGDAVAGDGAAELAAAAGLRVGSPDTAAFTVSGAFVGTEPGDWAELLLSVWKAPGVPIAVNERRVLWRRPVDEAFGFDELPWLAEPLYDPVFEGIARRGPATADGELVADVFLRIPAGLSQPCLVVRVGGQRIETGPVADGLVRFGPSHAPHPLLRHRLWVHLPHASEPAALALELTSCRTGSVVAAIDLGVVEPDTALPTRAQLTQRLGIPDPSIVFDDPTDVGVGPPLAADGLPALSAGEEWALWLGGSIDPGGWDQAAWADPHPPLAALAPYWRTGVTVVDFDAVASGGGPRFAKRRTAPETLDALVAGNVDAVWFESLNGTALSLGEARARGMWAGGYTEEELRVGPPDELPVVALLPRATADDGYGHPRYSTTGPTPETRARQRVSGARQHADLVFSLHSERRLHELLARQLGLIRRVGAAEIVAAGFDGAFVFGDAIGPVEVWDGVPIVWSLPPLLGSTTEAGHDSFVVRLTVGPTGVTRMDFLPIHAGNGRVEVLHHQRAQALLEEIAARSEPLGTEIVVKGDIASIEVLPRKRPPPSGVQQADPRSRPEPLPPPELAEECRGDPPPRAHHVRLGDALEVAWTQTVSLYSSHGGDDDGTFVSLWWKALRPLGPTRRVVSTRSGTTVTGGPCEGAWAFDRMRVGQWVSDGARFDYRKDGFGARLSVYEGDRLLRPPSGDPDLDVIAPFWPKDEPRP